MLLRRPFWYLRHGQTDWNAQNLSQGRTDIPLNATGREQAIKAGDALSRHWRDGASPIARIISSPLTRAHDTALAAQEAIAVSSGITLPLSTDRDLEEVCFGEMEGEPMGDWYDPWIEGKFTPKGCETFDGLKTRASEAVNRALEQDGIPMIVAHGALFRALRAAMDLPINVRLANAVPLYCDPTANGWVLTAYE
ncbi:histidine phosphatase family protein [Asaia sp. HN010]|uniref:histidine phosphatase family protein n=1 Tax=Asaia sp. HN010 TaxID=3081233 RepID=UPI00301A76D6